MNKFLVANFVVIFSIFLGFTVSYANTKNIISKTHTASGTSFAIYNVPGANFCITGVELDFKTPAPDSIIFSIQTQRGIPASSDFPVAAKTSDGWIDISSPVCVGDGFKEVLTNNTTSGAVVDVHLHGFYMDK